MPFDVGPHPITHERVVVQLAAGSRFDLDVHRLGNGQGFANEPDEDRSGASGCQQASPAWPPPTTPRELMQALMISLAYNSPMMLVDMRVGLTGLTSTFWMNARRSSGRPSRVPMTNSPSEVTSSSPVGIMAGAPSHHAADDPLFAQHLGQGLFADAVLKGDDHGIGL